MARVRGQRSGEEFSGKLQIFNAQLQSRRETEVVTEVGSMAHMADQGLQIRLMTTLRL